MTNPVCPAKDDEVAVLDTFPEEDSQFIYHKVFEIPKEYLIGILETMDSFNSREGVDLERFYQEYIWDETEVIYCQAKRDGKIISEWSE